ncbi:hypothetical protein V1520DRAFT_342674 [Lipomyces starkeyi]|uniref:Uncharacterized protein n=1 Tax=Lipomyces starkeyi NRRL Y-11557 TaxID=675824 RepID=A0A1E3Q984_LIPST|nr:hypothetical protein LIPSTDRAFT_103423 [Lipomyces starkeyi NRRL Y-11557]
MATAVPASSGQDSASHASWTGWMSSDFHFLITAVLQSRATLQPGQSSSDFWQHVVTLFARLGNAHGRPQEIVNLEQKELRRIFYDCMKSARQVNEYEIWRASVAGTTPPHWWDLDISMRQKFLKGGPFLSKNVVARLLDYFQQYSQFSAAKPRVKVVQGDKSSSDARAQDLPQQTSVSNPTAASSANRPKDIVQPVLDAASQSTGEFAPDQTIRRGSTQGRTPPSNVDERPIAKRPRLDVASKDTKIPQLSLVRSTAAVTLPLEPSSDVVEVSTTRLTASPTRTQFASTAHQEIAVPNFTSVNLGATATQEPIYRTASPLQTVELTPSSLGLSNRSASQIPGPTVLKASGAPPGGLTEAYLDNRCKDLASRRSNQDRLLQQLQNIITDNQVDPGTLGLSLQAWMAYARAVWTAGEEQEIQAEEEFVKKLLAEDADGRKKS